DRAGPAGSPQSPQQARVQRYLHRQRQRQRGGVPGQGHPMTLVRGFWLVAAAALVLALRAPLAVMVLGLIAFGVLHNVLELRYVAGRYETILRGRLLWVLLAL